MHPVDHGNLSVGRLSWIPDVAGQVVKAFRRLSRVVGVPDCIARQAVNNLAKDMYLTVLMKK
jgi:hypothetical protein